MKRWLMALVLAVAAAATAVILDGGEPVARLLLSAGLPDAAIDRFAAPGWRGAALYRAGRYDEAASAFWAAGPDYAFDRGDALAASGRYAEALEAFDTALAFKPDDAQAAANRALIEALLQKADTGDSKVDMDGGTATKEMKSRSSDPTGDKTEAKSSGEGLAGDKQANSLSSRPGGAKVDRQGNADRKSADPGGAKATGSAGDSDGVGRTSVTEAVVAKAMEAVRKREMGKSFDASSVSPSRQWLKTIDDDPGRYLKLRLAAEHARRVAIGQAVPEEVDRD
jgi:Ca-activated chloride channel homolog